MPGHLRCLLKKWVALGCEVMVFQCMPSCSHPQSSGNMKPFQQSKTMFRTPKTIELSRRSCVSRDPGLHCHLLRTSLGAEKPVLEALPYDQGPEMCIYRTRSSSVRLLPDNTILNQNNHNAVRHFPRPKPLLRSSTKNPPATS